MGLLLIVPTAMASVFIYGWLYWLIIPPGQFIDAVHFDYQYDLPQDTFYLQREKWQTLTNCQEDQFGNQTCAEEAPLTWPLRRYEKYDVDIHFDTPNSPQIRNMGVVMVNFELQQCDRTPLVK